MEYGPYYSVIELANGANRILALLDKFQPDFFVDKKLPYDRREISCAVQIGKQLKLNNELIPITAHPAIHSALSNIDYYEKKDILDASPSNHLIASTLYSDILWIIGCIINLITDVYEKAIEGKLSDLPYMDAIKFLTMERQTEKYSKTHPEAFLIKYREYLNKRINDYKELIELDKIDFGIEIKDIITSYKLGLELNIKGRNLLTPLLEGDYPLFVENLRNTLFLPSYHDIPKNEKERYYHLYLLGVLEGRLNLYNLKSNKESGFGRYDICGFPINKSNPGLIIEVKSDNTDGKAALLQIESNNYVNELRIEGVKKVLAVALNFRSKEINTDYKVILID